MAATRRDAAAVLQRHWREDGGYTSPNAGVYPWSWLWDSCFHAIVWAELGDARALTELTSVFRWQHPDGFVPHMGYQLDPGAATAQWGRAGASTITQPPMYGHAARELARRGFALPEPLIDAIRRGFAFLLERRRVGNGLLAILHPWEGGDDDSPRWDAWCDGPFDRFGRWRDRKQELVRSLQLTPDGAAVASDAFTVQAAGFNALCAFNLREFGELTGDASLLRSADELADALDRRWDPAVQTWTDAAEGEPASSSVRALDGLYGVLVTRRADAREAVWRQLFDDTAYGARFGPCGVHRAEPCFDPTAYWRGATWPQMNYLFWVAAVRQGRVEEGEALARQTAEAATRSGYAEYWHPDTAEGFGAHPQSWTALWLPMTAGQPVRNHVDDQAGTSMPRPRGHGDPVA